MKNSKVILRSFDKYSSFCSFDPKSKFVNIETEKFSDSDGIFSYLGGGFLGVYKNKGELFIVVDQDEYSIDLLHFDHKKKGLSRQLIVAFDENKIKTYKYKSTFKIKDFILDIISLNDTLGADEDYDFGLFLKNLIESDERKGIFLNPDCEY
jgi:hypothetical protein